MIQKTSYRTNYRSYQLSSYVPCDRCPIVFSKRTCSWRWSGRRARVRPVHYHWSWNWQSDITEYASILQVHGMSYVIALTDQMDAWTMSTVIMPASLASLDSADARKDTIFNVFLKNVERLRRRGHVKQQILCLLLYWMWVRRSLTKLQIHSTKRRIRRNAGYGPE